MRKKDFIALADFIMGQFVVGIPPHASFTQDQIEALAAFLAREHPSFKRKLWLDYIAGKCGPSGGKR